MTTPTIPTHERLLVAYDRGQGCWTWRCGKHSGTDYESADEAGDAARDHLHTCEVTA